MASYLKQRAERMRLRMSAMGKASQRVQAERRMVDLPGEVDHLPNKEL